MDRRKDTIFKGTSLPKECLEMVQALFNKNFKKHLSAREVFLAFGEVFPDELVMAVSMKHSGQLGMTTCYGSVDFPLANGPKGTANQVQAAAGQCIDAIASFFGTFFDEKRPVDYDNEYRQMWTTVELEKNKKTYLRINRDNLELDAQADAILELDIEKRNKKKLN